MSHERRAMRAHSKAFGSALLLTTMSPRYFPGKPPSITYPTGELRAFLMADG